MHPDVIGGRYRVGEAIGQGGMGTVWLCRDETLQRDVAVKQVGLLPGESVTDSARALREARSSAALSHRNVVTVFDVVEEDRAIWLVMEYVPGRSLADLVRDDGRLDPVRVADIGAQVADGLAAAHAVGTVHRDVKPGNVLIKDDGTAKISDFGIARVVGDPALTHSGLLTGTPAYFSPELARGASPAPASDVWALGATLYAAVEGRPPYKLQQPVAVLHEISTSQPPPPRYADFLEPVLLRMLDRDPDLRWSMADAAHALQRLVREHSPREETIAVTRSQPRAVRPAAAAAAGLASASAASSASDRSTDRSSANGPDRSGDRPGDRSGDRPAGGPVVVASSRAAGSVPPGSARPTRPSSGDPGGGRGRRALLALLALAALAAVVVGGVYLTNRGGQGATAGSGQPSSAAGSTTPSDTPSASESASESQTSSPSSSPTASPTRTPSSRTSAPESEDATPEEGGAGLTSTSPETFIRAYFATAPGGNDAAWARLGPGEQAQGRSRYDGFWSTISSVTVSDVQPAGGDDVEVTLTYRSADGRVSPERKRFDLIESPDGGWLINGERAAG